MKNLKYSLALRAFPKFGPGRLKKLEEYFGDEEAAFRAGLSELLNAGLEENVAREFIETRDKIKVDKILAIMESQGIKTLSIDDKAYPSLLKQIHNPPRLLFYRGRLDLNNAYPIAVVGTRKYSRYGKSAVASLVKELVENKITIISGLAFGIDALAHVAALENGGQTIAVLGSGVDDASIHPSANFFLAKKIIASGALLSEFPPTTKAEKYHFPMRNRIIAGLSLGTLVVEAPLKSGALITAFQALEQNREVFAVPGNIDQENSAGANMLIQKGARLVKEVKDILETLNLQAVEKFRENKKILPASKDEELVLACFKNESLHIDEIARLAKLSPAQTSSALVIMEMKGMVKNTGNMNYAKIY